MTYFNLSKQYASLEKRTNKEKQIKEEIRVLVKKRADLNSKSELIELVNLLDAGLGSLNNYDELLYSIISLATSDMRFDNLSITDRGLRLSGDSSSMNGNYSFYTFLQQLEYNPYVKSTTYGLSQGSDFTRSRFNVSVVLNEK